jgi:hypothetical protein
VQPAQMTEETYLNTEPYRYRQNEPGVVFELLESVSGILGQGDDSQIESEQRDTSEDSGPYWSYQTREP